MMMMMEWNTVVCNWHRMEYCPIVIILSPLWVRDICWCRSDHKPESLVVEITTTLSWSSAAVSEW